jgi:hypothetical protein
MSDLDTKKLRELLANATQGPFTLDDYHMYVMGPNSEMLCMIRGAGANLPMEHNGKLITAAVNSLPALLDRLEAAEAKLRSVREALQDYNEAGLEAAWFVNKAQVILDAQPPADAEPVRRKENE